MAAQDYESDSAPYDPSADGYVWNAQTGSWELPEVSHQTAPTLTAVGGAPYDASTADTRTQAERIAANDSPAGSTEYQGTSGRIDNVIGDTSALEAQLRAEAAARGVAYDPSDLEGILRNTGYQSGGMSYAQALANQLGIYDQRALYDGISVQDRGPYINGTAGGGSTGTSSGSGSWFNSNAPSAGFGAVPSPFGETYSTLGRPDYLQGAYVPPTWSDTYQPLTEAELMGTPGYQSRFDQGMQANQRSAAANGSILGGGFQKAINRYGQDYAANEYAAADARKFRDYQQRYGQFVDSANLGQQARLINEGAYQSDVGNNNTQYLNRFNAYQTAINNTRNAENDYWQRNQDLVQNSLQAAALARP